MGVSAPALTPCYQRRIKPSSQANAGKFPTTGKLKSRRISRIYPSLRRSQVVWMQHYRARAQARRSRCRSPSDSNKYAEGRQLSSLRAKPLSIEKHHYKHQAEQRQLDEQHPLPRGVTLIFCRQHSSGCSLAVHLPQGHVAAALSSALRSYLDILLTGTHVLSPPLLRRIEAAVLACHVEHQRVGAEIHLLPRARDHVGDVPGCIDTPQLDEGGVLPDGLRNDYIIEGNTMNTWPGLVSMDGTDPVWCSCCPCVVPCRPAPPTAPHPPP